MRLRSFRSLVPSGLVLTVAALLAPESAEAAEPVGGLLFRADASVAPGAYRQYASNSAGQEAETYAATLGPRLALNLGYAPSRLIRLGFSASSDFSLNVIEHQGIPAAELDGWMRWVLGPTVGFRFGRRVPLELELGIGVSHLWIFGSQWSIGNPIPFDVSSKQFGSAGSALVVYRPGGPESVWGLHAGLLGGWGYSKAKEPMSLSSDTTSTTAVTGSLLLGLSVGL